MSSYREDKYQNLERLTRQRRFYLLFLLLFFIPPITTKAYEAREIGVVIGTILRDAILYSVSPIYPVFKVLPILLILAIVLQKNKATTAFSLYVAVSYVLFAILQSVAITEEYGIGIVTSNFVLFLMVAAFWFWEVLIKKNDFTPQKLPLWKYWVVPLAAFAYWGPINTNTMLPDFNLINMFTNSAGLAFCMMTPVFLGIMTLFFPKVNVVTFRMTSAAGIVLAILNGWNYFVVDPEMWWMGVLHIPLLIISLYGLALGFTRSELPLAYAKGFLFQRPDSILSHESYGGLDLSLQA